MEVDTLCPMCGRLDEDGGHLFFKCKHDKLIWRELLLEEKRSALAAASSATEMFRMIWQWEADVQLLIVVALWVMWSKRNDTNAGDYLASPSSMAGLIQKFYVGYKEIFTTRSKPATQACRWSKPAADWLKINVDGAFDPVTSKGGWGFVIRDNSGAVVGSGAGRIDHCMDAMHAEIQAALQALAYASDVGMTRLELAVDASNVREALTTQKYDLAPVGMLVRDAKFIMFTEFAYVKVVFYPRSCNAVADKLAHMGSELGPGSVMIWPDGHPNSVNDLVAAVQLASG